MKGQTQHDVRQPVTIPIFPPHISDMDRNGISPGLPRTKRAKTDLYDTYLLRISVRYGNKSTINTLQINT